MYNRLRNENSDKTIVRGYVIGNSHDKEMDFLMYTKNAQSCIRIDNRIEDVNAGRWLRLIVNYPHFNGQFVLNHDNCKGFDDYSSVPSSFYVYARFFPLKKLLGLGEIVMTVRVKLISNPVTKSWDYDCYEINPKHFIDPECVLHKAGFFAGRVFFVELQACPSGWIVLKCHENPGEDDYCDELTDPVVPYDVSYLDETDLPARLSRYQNHLRLDLRKIPVSEEESSSYFSENDTVLSKSSKNSGKEEEEESQSTTYSSYSSSSKSSVTPQKSNRTEETSSNFNSGETIKKRTVVDKKSVENAKVDKKNVENAKMDVSEKYADFFDTDDLQVTIGTSGLSMEPFFENLSDEYLRRLGREEASDEGAASFIPVTCVAVQKIDNFVLLYTPKKGVWNVLLDLEKCEGLRGKQIKVGDVEFFNVAARRNQSTDLLYSKLPFSHIAMSLIKSTSEMVEKAEKFLESVRSFENLLQLKIEVDLSSSQSVTPYFDEETRYYKSESDSQFYILKSTTNLLVSIPCERLKRFLKYDFTMDCKLQAWATRRRRIGEACLHIGATSEAICIHKNGERSILPPVSDFSLMSDMMRN